MAAFVKYLDQYPTATKFDEALHPRNALGEFTNAPLSGRTFTSEEGYAFHEQGPVLEWAKTLPYADHQALSDYAGFGYHDTNDLLRGSYKVGTIDEVVRNATPEEIARIGYDPVTREWLPGIKQPDGSYKSGSLVPQDPRDELTKERRDRFGGSMGKMYAHDYDPEDPYHQVEDGRIMVDYGKFTIQRVVPNLKRVQKLKDAAAKLNDLIENRGYVLPEAITVERGAYLPGVNFYDLQAMVYSAGKMVDGNGVFTEKGFTSTMVGPAERRADSYPAIAKWESIHHRDESSGSLVRHQDEVGSAIRFHITLPAGTKVASIEASRRMEFDFPRDPETYLRDFSGPPSKITFNDDKGYRVESELLLGSGAQFRVVKVQHGKKYETGDPTLKPVQIEEVWLEYIGGGSSEGHLVKKGGPGSGRYPKGSGRDKNTFIIDAFKKGRVLESVSLQGSAYKPGEQVLEETDDYNSTKFILPDGTRLAHGFDTHYTAAEVLGIDMYKALQAGVLRYTAGTGGEIGAPITHAQAQHLIDGAAFVKSYGMEGPYVDVFVGKERYSRNFEANATADTVRNWVNSHFVQKSESFFTRVLKGITSFAIDCSRVLKFQESQHPREEAGQPTGGQFTDGSGGDVAPDPVLAQQAVAGIAAVEKLLPLAVETANYSHVSGDVTDWNDVPSDIQDGVYDKWRNNEYENSDVDTSDLDAETIKNLHEDNEYILEAAKKKALEKLVQSSGNNFPDLESVLPLADETGKPMSNMDAAVESAFGDHFQFQLVHHLDPDTFDYGDGDDGGRDHTKVALDLDQLRFTNGQELTDLEKQKVQEIWDFEYRKAFDRALEDAFESSEYNDARNELESDQISEKWQELTNSDKLALLNDYGLQKQSRRTLSAGEPYKWVTGIEDTEDEDDPIQHEGSFQGREDYARTHAIAHRLTELRTDELRAERMKGKELPPYKIEDHTIEKGPLKKPNFVIYDKDGVSVGVSSTYEHAEQNAKEWQLEQAALNVSTKDLIHKTWEEWKGSSSGSFANALQLASALEFNGNHRLTTEEIKYAVQAATPYGGIDTLRAYARAQWEVTQMILSKSGHKDIDVYRAIMLDKDGVDKTPKQFISASGKVLVPQNIDSHVDGQSKKPIVTFDFANEHFVVEKKSKPDTLTYNGEGDAEPSKEWRLETDEEAISRRISKYANDHPSWVSVKLPDVSLQRAGAQSTTGALSVANSWGGTSKQPNNPTRVVLRIAAPATSVLSIPVFGQNVQNEHETVLLGTKDRWAWDLWHNKAPSFEDMPISGHARKSEQLVVDLQALDRDQPHWMVNVCFEELRWQARHAAKLAIDCTTALKFDEALHPRDKDGKFTDKSVTSREQAFKKWFGKSKVVDEDGHAKIVYHGTTHDITEFAPAGDARLNVEADWGAGNYFTDTQDDLNTNYATEEGPDLTGRIELRAEQIESESEVEDQDAEHPYHMTHEEALRKAREELAPSGARTIPVYLSLQNPYVLGDSDLHKETKFTYESNYDAEDDSYGEPTGTLVDFLDAVKREAHDFDETEGIDDFAQSMMEQAMDYEGISASDLDKAWRSHEKLGYITNDKGELAGHELYRRALERMGFDGIIDHTVYDKFGGGKSIGRPMEGMDPDTTHYVVFKPSQIKSAIGNVGTFDPLSNLITKRYIEVFKSDV